MKLLSVRASIHAVADRWRAQYLKQSGWYVWQHRPASWAEDVHKRLLALDASTATPADVDACMAPFGGWCDPERCHECGVVTYDLVRVGEEPDYESATANICRMCLLNALDLVDPLSRR